MSLCRQPHCAKPIGSITSLIHNRHHNRDDVPCKLLRTNSSCLLVTIKKTNQKKSNGLQGFPPRQFNPGTPPWYAHFLFMPSTMLRYGCGCAFQTALPPSSSKFLLFVSSVGFRWMQRHVAPTFTRSYNCFFLSPALSQAVVHCRRTERS